MEKPVTGVVSLQGVDLDALNSLYILLPHDGDEGEEGALEPEEQWFANKPWRFVDGKWVALEATFIACLNHRGYLQVVLSPVTGRHNPCSPCYPGQGNLEEEGNLLCYELPENLRQDLPA